MLLQHLVVLGLVTSCLIYLARGVYSTLTAKRSQFGKCCATGCDASADRTQQGRGGERLVFVPVESLSRRRS